MSKRVISFSIAVVLILSSAIGRIGYIIFSGIYTVSEGYNSYVLTIDTVEPTLYYQNAEKMTNNKVSYVAVLRPNEKTLADLHNLFSSSEIKKITDELKQGYPIIKQIDSSKKNNARYIEIFKTVSSEYPSAQLIAKKSSGLLSYIDSYGEKRISFSIDAKGRLLQGDKGTVNEINYNTKQGLTLSIDKEIERITYEACKNMENGCAVVMDVSDASILACVTKPDESYINKVFERYSVGSVFKIIVASCALENDCKFFYYCNGKTKVGDTEFSCQGNHIHGFETLKTALANSCNCYFVNLALKLKEDKILKTAKEFGFDDSIVLYDNWKIKGASLPSKNDLNSKGQLALFGFGQGKLTAAPLQMCYALCTIANGGKKSPVKLVLSKVNENGYSTKIGYEEGKSIIGKDTSETMLEYLRYVVTNGTGASAETYSHKSAGKTATAQTGQFSDGRELLNTWFAGIYPYDKPKYAIVIMTENGTSGAENCCPIYSTIVEMLEDL